jgi:non-specific serine/threonine protein kinase
LNAEAHNPNPLSVGTRVAEYVITGVLGEGGFGIVYSARDEQLQRTIAIKEYLPTTIAGRTGDLSVRVRSLNNFEAFSKGLQSFMREASLLAQFTHPALVDVYRVWEQNATAYIAMRMCVGQTARDLRREMNQGMSESQIRHLLKPVFSAVETLHRKDVIHRDISPDNVMISPAGAATLLDLGAARMVLAGLTQALTTVLKPGYAPIEQYTDDGSWQQGPWTDVYGLAALMYFLVNGTPPAQAVARALRDTYVPLPAVGELGYSQRFVDAVAHALSVQPTARFQTVAEFADALGWTDETANANVVFRDVPNPVAAAVKSVDPDETVALPRRAAALALRNVLPDAPPVERTNAVQISEAHASLMVTPSASPTVATPQPARSKTPWIVGGAALALITIAGIGVQRYSEGSATHSALTAPSNAQATPPPPAAVPAPLRVDAVRTPSPSANPPPITTLPAPAPAAAPPPTPPAKSSVTVLPPDVSAEVLKILDAQKKRDADAAALGAQRKREEREAAKLAVAEAQRQQLAIESAATKQRDERDEADRLLMQKREEQTRLEKAKSDAIAKAEADSIAKARAAPPTANQAVNDLSALALQAYRDGRVQEARNYWGQIANLPEASGRSRAQALANSARTYCKAGDNASCERLYTQALRADASFRISDADAAQTQTGDAFRAARAKSGSGY